MSVPEYADPDPDVDGTEWIHVANHAANRYRHRRRADCRVGPRVAWFDGEPLDDHGLEGDEARYHAASRTVLVRKDSHVVTAVGLAYARPRTRRAVAALEDGGSA